tara:strand:+ start:4938 stop:5198 length:261 start_codon:yes stop_codon:yes gene_type:complete
LDALEILKSLSDKPIVVGLALIGAIFTILPNLLSKKPTSENVSIDDNSSIDGGKKLAWEKLANKIGYWLMGLSVFLFIVAGFIVDL